MNILTKNIAVLMITIFSIIGLSGCADYNEQGIGKVTVIKKNAAPHTEGGGIEPDEFWTGTKYATSFIVSHEAFNLSYTPRRITLKDVKIPMSKLKNQEMSWSFVFTYMHNPHQADLFFGKFPSGRDQLKRIFLATARSYIRDLDVGLSADGTEEGGENQFADRPAVADEIFALTKAAFVESYPQYKDIFYFISASIGNVDFPPGIIASYAKTATAKYETDKLEVKKDLRKVLNSIAEEEASIAASQAAIEAGSVSNDVLNYKNASIYPKLAEDANTNLIVIMPVDERGNFTWFQIDK